MSTSKNEPGRHQRAENPNIPEFQHEQKLAYKHHREAYYRRSNARRRITEQRKAEDFAAGTDIDASPLSRWMKEYLLKYSPDQFVKLEGPGLMVKRKSGLSEEEQTWLASQSTEDGTSKELEQKPARERPDYGDMSLHHLALAPAYSFSASSLVRLPPPMAPGTWRPKKSANQPSRKEIILKMATWR